VKDKKLMEFWYFIRSNIDRFFKIRIKENRSIMIFPEGTRTAAKQKAKYFLCQELQPKQLLLIFPSDIYDFHKYLNDRKAS
jgi:hypothetical protein